MESDRNDGGTKILGRDGEKHVEESIVYFLRCINGVFP